MKTSARFDYGLRAVVALARAGEPRKGDELATDGAMPFKYLESVLADLRRAGIVRSKRGGSGGYWLARPAAAITVADLVTALDPPAESAGPTAVVHNAMLAAAGAITVADLAR